MKHLVLFSLFTVCASYSMDRKDRIEMYKDTIMALKRAYTAYERRRELIIKNNLYRYEQFMNSDHNQKQSHERGQRLDRDSLHQLAVLAILTRQRQVTDQEKKEVEELVVKNLDMHNKLIKLDVSY